MTRQRLYLETMEEVLPKVQKVIIEPGTATLLPYLPAGRPGGPARRAARRDRRTAPGEARCCSSCWWSAAALAALVKAGEYGIGPVVVTREDEQKLILAARQSPRATPRARGSRCACRSSRRCAPSTAAGST